MSKTKTKKRQESMTVWIVIILWLLMCGVIIFLALQSVSAQYNDVTITKLPPRDPLESVREIAEEIAEQEYILHEHDCTQFSQELVDVLTLAGYDAICVYGKKVSLHTWVIVTIDGKEYPIEATTGQIFNQDDTYYKNHYKIIKRGKCL